jgi:hypothetical protein
MAISSSYYLNAPSLASATSVFTDDTLLVLAADGFYSDGVISREQVGGVLLPQQTCPSCVSYNCVEGICTDPGDGSGTYATLEECEASCGGPTYYTYSVRLDNSTGTICAQTPINVYSSSILLTTGDIIYYDTALTVLVTGYNYVVRATGSPNIYELNPATAVIGIDTTLTC